MKINNICALNEDICLAPLIALSRCFNVVERNLNTLKPIAA